VQREAEQHREQQHWQHLALGESVDHRVRDDREQKVARALHLAGRGVGRDALGDGFALDTPIKINKSPRRH
jgi:hypothetical protein